MQRMASIITAMADAPVTTVERRRGLLRLMAWLSPAFPTGAFSYSAGLETAIVEGHIVSQSSLAAWLSVLLAEGGWRNDAILLAEAYRCHQDAKDLTALLDLAAALASSRERHEESVRLGAAFVAAAAAWPHPTADLLKGPVSYPVAVGAIASAHGVDLEDALVAFLQAQVSQAASVAIRLGLIGQSGGVTILAGLEAELLQAAKSYAGSTLDDLGSATITADLLSMRHESQYSRLFQS